MIETHSAESVRASGRGSAIAHHGELLQGMFSTPAGPRRGLVTLVCERFSSHAVFATGGDGLTVEPAWCSKAAAAAALALEHLGSPRRGALRVTSDIPTGWGLGSSTADVVAAIRAVADAHGAPLAGDQIALLAVAAERASDSLMFEDRAVLFAQREGKVLRDFGGPLPALEVLGFNSGPRGSGVDTLAMPPAVYDAGDIARFDALAEQVECAVQRADARLLAEVATASALINQRHLPKPCFDRLLTIVEQTGGAGLSVAHTGTVVGLLYPASTVTPSALETARGLLAEIGFGETWRFATGPRPSAGGGAFGDLATVAEPPARGAEAME